MPVAAFAALTALMVGNLILVIALVARRRAERQAWPGQPPPLGEPIDLAIELAPENDKGTAAGSGIRTSTYDRVVRIVSYTFLLVTAIIVAAGGLWPTQAPAIYLLLLVGAATVFLLHEVAPRAAEAGEILLAEGIAVVTFFTLLIVLTGGVASPFFFGYFLIVAAAALVTGGGASLVLAAGITAAYLGALLLQRGGQPFTTEQAVIVVVNMLALWLLSYLASVVAGEQRRTRDAALRLSLHDPLTRLYNRTFLFAVIEREIARASRTSRRFSLLMLDLDGLKPINDRFGHYFGDRMLQAVAEAVRLGIRVIDSPARYGGDEFVVLLPETDAAGAAVVAEKLRRSVAAIRLNAGTELIRTTASIGVVAFPDDGRTADALTNRADQVMYAAKRAGRDRVSVEGLEHVTVASSATMSDGGDVASAATAEAPASTATTSGATGTAAASAPRSRPTSAQRRPRRPASTAGRLGLTRVRVARGPYPSMFADHPPITLRPTRPGPRSSVSEPSGGAGGAGSSASASSRQPTTRSRRFRIDHPHDPSFERAMDLFLQDGRPDGPTLADDRGR